MVKNLLYQPITTAEKQLNSKAEKVDFLPNTVFLKETADFL
jgi:hypothetical protein